MRTNNSKSKRGFVDEYGVIGAHGAPYKIRTSTTTSNPRVPFVAFVFPVTAFAAA